MPSSVCTLALRALYFSVQMHKSHYPVINSYLQISKISRKSRNSNLKNIELAFEICFYIYVLFHVDGIEKIKEEIITAPKEKDIPGTLNKML